MKGEAGSFFHNGEKIGRCIQTTGPCFEINGAGAVLDEVILATLPKSGAAEISEPRKA
jgi:hypothetical protein